MNKFYVYMYMDQDNVPFYIGKGKGGRYYPKKHKHGHTYDKIKSIGVDNVKVHFLHKNLTEEDAFKWEVYWIKYLGRRDLGTGQLTNHTDGGEGGSHPAWNKGKKSSEETKQKISIAKKGTKLSDRTKQKMSEAQKGKKNSVEHNQRISEARKGIKHTEEACQKMSKSKTGRKLSEETKQKISESNKGKPPTFGMLGKKLTKEQKQKISDANRSRIMSEETKQKISATLKRKHKQEEDMMI